MGTANDSKCGRIENNEEVVVKIEEDGYFKVNKRFKSKFIGVSYYEKDSKWHARRWSKDEKRDVTNGCYDDEQTAAHASDSLARKLMENGEQKFKLNFPDDHTEVYHEIYAYSKFIGVTFNKNMSKWRAQRHSKTDNKTISNGCYNDEETAAHASDTLARKLMENGEQIHKLNFPDDHTETLSKKRKMSPKFIGVTYIKKKQQWRVQRWSKTEQKTVHNGYYDDDETAAHASDNLARQLMENGKQRLQLNFPDDHTEVYSKENQKKRKRQNEIALEYSQNN